MAYFAARYFPRRYFAPRYFPSGAAAGGSPHLVLTPSGLFFFAVQGGSNPSSQPVAITNSGGGAISPALGSIVENSGTGWLGGSVLGTTLTVSITSGALANGVYTGTVGVTSVGADNTPQTVAVTLTVATYSPSTGGGGAAGPGPATRVVFIASRRRR